MQRASKSDTHVYNIYGINQEEPGGREVTSKKGEEERKGRKKNHERIRLDESVCVSCQNGATGSDWSHFVGVAGDFRRPTGRPSDPLVA